MLKNYFKTALRSLSRNRVYSILNMLGLALGIGCSLVIFKVISFEESFDKHQKNFEHIYRVVNEGTRPNGVVKGMGTPHPVAPAILQDYPEIREAVRTHYVGDTQVNVKEGDNMHKFLLEEGVVFTENRFFTIFNAVFIVGDATTALTRPNTAVVSASLCRQFFGYKEGEEAKAVGRVVNVANREDFEVVGVIADPPETTNFPFTVLLEYHGQEKINPYFREGKEWNSTGSNTNTYLLVGAGFEPDRFNEKLIDLVEKNYEEGASASRKFLVQPLAAVHVDDEYGNYIYSTPSGLIRALAIIGIFLVLTACINFVNLATAQAAKRSKEIGIRKALGGYSIQLVAQFFLEITLITLFALCLSLVISEFLFINLEEVIGTRLKLDLFNGLETMGFLLGLLVVVSFLSGFYPSILLSRMNTVLALKSKITANNGSGGLNLRKALVVVQFAISQFLIIGTVIISAQMSYFLSKDLGFDKEAIVKTYLPEQDEVKSERFRNLMLNDPAIAKVTFALSSPTGSNNAMSNFNYAPLESKDNYIASYKPADEHYMDLYGLELLAGRGLKKEDSMNFAIINQRTADLMGFEDNYEGAIGERLTSGWRRNKLKVIGVMSDFHSQDLGEALEYVFLLRDVKVFYEIAFKTSGGANVKTAISHFEEVWDQVYPEYVVDWQFFDDELSERYEREESIASLMNTFSLVSIVIGCMGLYGLIAFVSASRTKEVGIRKVLGASVLGIIGRFSREVLILVAMAFAIAAPLAYVVLNQWLNDYEFRIEIGPGFFAMAFLVTLVIASLTISYNTLATALMNPAKILKDE